MARARSKRVARSASVVLPAAPPQLPTVPSRVPMQFSEIVQGIRLDVPGRELVVRLGERIRWHRERGDWLIAQIKTLTEVERQAGDALAGALGHYDSPRTALEKKLRDHQERASFLMFLRDHVNEKDVYRLDSADLRMTEILPERPR